MPPRLSTISLRRLRVTLRHAALSALTIGAFSNCSDSPTGPGEPSVTPIDLRELVAGTVAAGGSVTYSLLAPGGAPLLIGLQARTGSIADTLVATVTLAASDAVLATLRSAGTQAFVRENAVLIAAAGAERDLRIAVRGATPSVSGPFHLEARPLGATPEWADVQLVAGTIASDRIDGPGDVDEFTLPGITNNMALVQLAADVPFPDGLRVELLDGTTVLTSVTTTAAQAVIGELAAPGIQFPSNGPFTVRVRAGGDTPSANTGGYRIRVSSLTPPRPPLRRQLIAREIRVDTITPADSVVSWQTAWSTPQYSIAFTLEVLDSRPGDTLTATFQSEDGDIPVGVISAAVDGGVVSFATPLVVGPAPYALIAVVRGRRLGTVATYRVRYGSLLPDAPETVPALLVPGDTLAGESIGDPLDMDRYVFDPDPSDTSWVVMLVPDTASSELGILVHDREHNLVADWNVTGQWTELERTATLLTLRPDRGPYLLTVGAEFYGGGFSGGYRLRVARVDRTAEGSLVPVAPGATVTGAIEQPGDIDDIRLDVVEGDEMYFHHQRQLPGVAQHFRLLDGQNSLGVQSLPDEFVPLNEQLAHFFWRAPRTGSFTIRMFNDQLSGPASYWPAPYAVEVRKVNRAPETASATGWAFGDTVSGESVERREDIDEFQVTIDAPRMTQLTFIAHRADPGDGAVLSVLDADGNPVGGASLDFRSGSDTMFVSPHVEFHAAGTYMFRVQSSSFSPMPYRFFLKPSHLGPESISDTLPVGLWVAGESIDSIGDFDRYVIPMVAGMRYVAELELLPGASGGMRFTAGDLFARTDGTISLHTSATTGYVLAGVGEFPSLAGPGIGPYRLRVQEVSFQPETAPALLMIGDMVETEAIDGLGDEDTFTFTGVAGDLLRLSAQSVVPGARLHLQIQSDAGFPITTVDLGQVTKDFTLPSSGTFRIVVRAESLLSTRDFGLYAMSLVRR